MEVVLVIVLFLSLAAALFAFAVALSMPKSEMAARLSTLLSEKSEPQATPAIQQRLEEAAERLGQIAPKSPAQLSNTRALLLNAGLREPRHMTYYIAARIAFAGLTLLAIVLTGLVFRQPVLLAAVAIAYSVPRVFLKRAARKRQHAIQMGLPDALDLAVICVESGIGLDGAIRRVADELGDVHTELSEEFLLVNFEIRAGTPRPDALRYLGERTGVDDIKSLSAVL
ncbi:MAG: type II secretion system F family protein, partial [Candidatus Korobacteraceae bacterium]